MAVPSLEPIYLSNTFVDIVGIEFKDTIERIEIVKDFVNKSKNNVEALEKELVKRKSEARESELTINNKSETEL